MILAFGESLAKTEGRGEAKKLGNDFAVRFAESRQVAEGVGPAEGDGKAADVFVDGFERGEVIDGDVNGQTNAPRCPRTP